MITLEFFPALFVFHWTPSSIKVQVWPAPFWFPSLCLAPINHALFCLSRFSSSFCTSVLLSRFYFVGLCRQGLYKSRIAIWKCKKGPIWSLHVQKQHCDCLVKKRGLYSEKWSYLAHFNTIPSKTQLPFTQYLFLPPFLFKKDHYNFSNNN